MLIKKENIMFFFIDQDQFWGGNLRAYFEYTYYKKEYKIVIINNGRTADSEIKSKYDDIIVESKITLKLLFLAMKAKFFFVTHGIKPLNGILAGVQGYKLINLWHGIPIKAMGNLQSSNYNRASKIDRVYKKGKSYDLVCCSSVTDKAMMSACLFIPGDRLFVSGIPKADWLTCPVNELPLDYINDLSVIDRVINGRKLVFYSPTGRDNPAMDYFFDVDELEKLSDFLAVNNCIIGFRYHGLHLQNEFRRIHGGLIEQNRILDLGIDLFSESNIILRKTSLLIGDYSSIIVDFLITNKPIIKFAYDVDDYLKNRGLLYNYEKMLPGILLKESASLGSVILDALNNYDFNEYPEKWLFYMYEDSRSCERLYQRMIEL